MREEYLPYLEQAQYLIDQNHVHWCTDPVKLAMTLYNKKKDLEEKPKRLEDITIVH